MDDVKAQSCDSTTSAFPQSSSSMSVPDRAHHYVTVPYTKRHEGLCGMWAHVVIIQANSFPRYNLDWILVFPSSYSYTLLSVQVSRTVIKGWGDVWTVNATWWVWNLTICPRGFVDNPQKCFLFQFCGMLLEMFVYLHLLDIKTSAYQSTKSEKMVWK